MNYRSMCWIPILISLLIPLNVTVVQADFKDGIDAYEAGDYVTAHRKFLAEAKKGNAEAQNKLGVMFSEGQGVRQNYKKAVAWHQKAAEQGYAEAQFNLGVMYSEGQGVRQHYKKAVAWYQKAAEQGHAKAQFKLEAMYRLARGVPQDDKAALKWVRMAAENELAVAQYRLGIMYKHGWKSVFESSRRGISPSFISAYMWFELAAANGNVDAAVERNAIVEILPPTRLEKAKRLTQEWREEHSDRGLDAGEVSDNETTHTDLLAEAHEGNAAAQFLIGVMCENGQGLSENYGEANKWYRKAAEQGDDDAQFALGNAHNGGILGTTYYKAEEWYLKAAGQGHVEAQFELGKLYGGAGVGLKDQSKANKWFEKAAEQGHAKAQSNLGHIYERFLDVPDYGEAAKWLRKAAEQGDKIHQYDLGIFYKKGADYVEAVKWFLKSAEQYLRVAQRELGFMYAKGLGVPQDNERAYMWFDISELFIIRPDIKKKITKVMTRAEIKEAKELAKAWREKHNQ